MSSRLIIKNLPKNITEKKLREIFEEKGPITDIQLKYTKDGVFRQFAFIGYENESDAKHALQFFNKSFIQTSKITVETCAALGSQEKPKSWSKYSNDSTAFRRIHGIEEQEFAQKQKNIIEEAKKKKNKNKIDEIVGEHKNDPEFHEFMKVHDKNRNVWTNDFEVLEGENEDTPQKTELDNQENSKKCEKSKQNYVTPKKNDDVENDKVSEEESEVDENDTDKDEELNNKKLALKSEVSDLEYMKSLMGNKTSSGSCKNAKVETKIHKTINQDFFTIKIRNVPLKTRKKDILEFFKPLKPNSIRIPSGKNAFCYVGFKDEVIFKKALFKDRSFIKGKQVFLSNFTEKNKKTKALKELEKLKEEELDKTGKWGRQENQLENEEAISESGKIFFRNLAYTTTDEDLQNLFEKYGPITEINLPVDSNTRKIKGFGCVTFVMPEHALQAFNELDGTIFRGRLLHLLPGKANDKNDDISEDNMGLSFKEKKRMQMKKSAGQSYNWNTLFLGANAVADLLAKQFGTKKETILDTEKGGSSAGVRLALGETQIVMEMKKFLEENGVVLDVFDTIPKKRSKTVILAKNLPAETTQDELTEIFSKYGLLGRVILPPSGVTAIIEFLEPSEAKKAFFKLAYSKFKYVPLYLEWAPENIFKSSSTASEGETKESVTTDETNKRLEENKCSKEDNVEKKVQEDKKLDVERNVENAGSDENDVEDDEAPEPGTTIFLKNLNFNTKVPAITEHFKRLGPIHLVQVAMRKDKNNPTIVNSLGYGFIQFKKKETAERALKEMQFTTIEGNAVELKRSDRMLKEDPKSLLRKKNKQTKQTGTKIMVKNIPFQTKTKEIFEIFKAFGELKSVRLPKKLTPGEEGVRGFGFVDFLSKSDARKAFESLSSSTHLYGRRLVLEWAKDDDDTNISDLRKRTAQTFNEVNSKKLKKSSKSVFDSNQMSKNNSKDDSDEDL